ncbi:helix-turn-helix transcriptional regulator [Clostridium bowmanii]|nr:helix-turn-helix transcriptional regulator [Clostridium bowmanii]
MRYITIYCIIFTTTLFVSMEVIVKICNVLECDIGDIMEVLVGEKL